VPADLLFAYGTLMRGFRLHRLLAGQAEYLGDGEIPGLLFDLGSYPGALRGAGGSIRGRGSIGFSIPACGWCWTPPRAASIIAGRSGSG